MKGNSSPMRTISSTKLALLAREFRSETRNFSIVRSEPIAIIGMGCRFPGGATGPVAYWDLLDKGVDAIREVPADRFEISDYYDPDIAAPGKIMTRYGGFIEKPDQFDPDFFGIAPREALSMDPQQRLFLEVAWEALSDAGLRSGNLQGSQTGIFLAITYMDYARLQYSQPSRIDAYSLSGTAHSIAVGRLSYLMNLKGPSIAVDTACSSSLVAVHLACQSLRLGESNIALAGGVSLILRPEENIPLSKWGMMSPDGRCKTFDATANGFVRGEGCGVIVLKRLSDALGDGDRILAIIRGSAVNQDGRSNSLTAPNGLSQQAVIREALSNAQVSPEQISYVEAHGTGTKLGDPIEMEALAEVIGRPRANGESCAVGSVKTNIGHLEAAAGIAGLCKVILCMQHERIAPHLHFTKLNPLINLSNTSLTIHPEGKPWPVGKGPRYAGVSAFGFGGTNAHVILEDAPNLPENKEEFKLGFPQRHVLPISARTTDGLTELASSYQAFLGKGGVGNTIPLRNICFTSSTKRDHYELRSAFIGGSHEEIRNKISGFLASRETLPLDPDRTGKIHPKLGFVFSGDDPSSDGPVKELMQGEPVFRLKLEECDAAFMKQFGRSMIEDSSMHRLQTESEGQTIHTAWHVAYQVAMFTLFRSYGIIPEYVVGYGIGEATAAHVAGILSLEETFRVVLQCCRSLESVNGKDMMTVAGVTAGRAYELLEDYQGLIILAAINSPHDVTFSGDPTAIRELVKKLEGQGIVCSQLESNYTFRNADAESVHRQLFETLRGLSLQAASIPIISTVTGKQSAGLFFEAGYWKENLCETIRFGPAIEEMIGYGCDIFLEISPRPVLGEYIRKSLESCGKKGSVLATLDPHQGERESLLAILGSLYSLGADIDWENLFQKEGRIVSLPAYPWQRKRYWFEVQTPEPLFASAMQHQEPIHPLLGHRVQSPIVKDFGFESAISATHPSFLSGHRIAGMYVLPAAAMLEMAIAAAKYAAKTGEWQSGADSLTAATPSIVLEDVIIHRALLLPEGQAQLVQFSLTPEKDQTAAFTLFSQSAGSKPVSPKWFKHADGKVRLNTEPELHNTYAPTRISLDEARRKCNRSLSCEALYQKFQEMGINFGTAFQGIEEVWYGDKEMLGHIRPPTEVQTDIHNYYFHPSLLDACLQMLGAALVNFCDDYRADVVFVPISIDRMEFFTPSNGSLWSYCRVREQHRVSPDQISGDLLVFDENGEIVATFTGLVLKATDTKKLMPTEKEDLDRWFYEVRWLPQPIDRKRIAPSASLPDKWIIFSDHGGVGDLLKKKIENQHRLCFQVYSGCEFKKVGQSEYEINPARPEEVKLILDNILNNHPQSSWGIVHMQSLDSKGDKSVVNKSLSEDQVQTCGSALHLLQAMHREHTMAQFRIWLVTRGAQTVDNSEEVDFVQAPIWGFGAVWLNEHPEDRSVRIDLDPKDSLEVSSDAIFNELELKADVVEDQIAFRHGDRYVARLAELEAQTLSDNHPGVLPEPLELQVGENGIIDELAFCPVTQHQPKPGEVEILIDAVGLNFKDVLNALKMFPGKGVQLGGECAGRIVSVGDGVSDFRVGDEVLAFALGTFRSYVTVPVAYVVHKPENLSMEEAASIPVVFLTVRYAFNHLNSLSPGDRVLIHAATGGVGLAAVQMAQRVGAEIFATAGNQEKRDFLKSIGVVHVMDSRSTAFADEIMKLTDNQGVDAVLNSLSGEMIPSSLSVLRSGGSFFEIGKRGIWDERKVIEFKDGISYFPFDLNDVAKNDPSLIQRMLSELMDDFKTGVLKPIRRRVFGINEVREAFRTMARAKHIGKIVVIFPTKPFSQAKIGPESIRGDGTYLITGGFGGLGVKTAQWLVDHGARHIALIGRRGAKPEIEHILENLRQAGAQVTMFQADVSSRQQIADVLNVIGKNMPPLRGIFHAAGVLDDGMLLSLDWQRFVNVMSPKIDGAWNLHLLTEGSQLDFFIFFSSVASILGWPGQGNYAAANAFLDALAHYRSNRGCRTLSINWGPWAEAGMAAEIGRQYQQRISNRGLRIIDPEDGLNALEKILQMSVVQIVAARFDWGKFASNISTPRTFFEDLIGSKPLLDKPESHAAGAPDLLKQLADTPSAQRKDILTEHIENQARLVMGIPPGKRIDRRLSLNEIGLDSLMAVELRNALSTLVGQRLHATLIFDYPTIESLANYIANDVMSPVLGQGLPVEASMAGASIGKKADDLESLSEREAEALLIEELKNIRNEG